MQLIGYKEIAKLLGTSESNLRMLISNRTIVMPPAIKVCTSTRKRYFSPSQIETAIARYKDYLDKKRNKTPSIGFDNQLARQFLISGKRKRIIQYGKTKIVHVEERNDAEIPHPELSRFSANAGYNIYLNTFI